MGPVNREPDRPWGDVYDPSGDTAARPGEGVGGHPSGAYGAEGWPAPAYDPDDRTGSGSLDPDGPSESTTPNDPSLARLLLDHLEGEVDASPERGLVMPLGAPDLRGRVLDRLQRELEASGPDLLVATGPGATEVGVPLADRTGRPMLREAAVPVDAARWSGSRVALVGSVLRPAAIADVLRAVEARGASVVAILGIAVRDGEDAELMSDYYNLFYIIHL